MATLQRNYPHPSHGSCDVVTVDGGKYSYVVSQDTETVVELWRYGQKWNRDDVFMIKYNAIMHASALELRDLLLRTQDDLK